MRPADLSACPLLVQIVQPLLAVDPTFSAAKFAAGHACKRWLFREHLVLAE